MEINSKDELLKVIEDMQSRLAVVEDSTTKKEPEDAEGPSDTATSTEEEEVESVDEIEKLLNS
jgi:hypothetical protein